MPFEKSAQLMISVGEAPPVKMPLNAGQLGTAVDGPTKPSRCGTAGPNSEAHPVFAIY